MEWASLACKCTIKIGRGLFKKVIVMQTCSTKCIDTEKEAEARAAAEHMYKGHRY